MRVNRKSPFNQLTDEPQNFGEWGTVVSRELYPTAEEARKVFAEYLGRIGGKTDIPLPTPAFVRYGYPPSDMGDDMDMEHGEGCWYGPVAEKRGAKPVWLWEGETGYR